MKITLKKLWYEYYAEECLLIETEEESALAKKALEQKNTVNELLTKEQKEAVEKYLEALYDLQASFNQNAFIKGCEFATSFLLESGNLNKK